MNRTLVFPVLVTAALISAPAGACSVLSPRLEQRAAEARERELSRADKVVAGDWTFLPGDQTDGLRWGIIKGVAKGHRPPRSYRVLTRQDLTCGFPNYPVDDSTLQSQSGRFYLKRERGTDYFTLIHFDSIARTN